MFYGRKLSFARITQRLWQTNILQIYHTDGMILIRQSWRTLRKTCLNAVMSTEDITQRDLGSKSGLRTDRSATKRPETGHCRWAIHSQASKKLPVFRETRRSIYCVQKNLPLVRTMHHLIQIHTSHNIFNPLKTKRRLLYLKTQFVPRSKHFSSRL